MNSKRRALSVLGLLLVGCLIYVVPRFIPFGKHVHTVQKEAKPLYYCPMHPTYISDRPGDCPICYMKLEPKPQVVPTGVKSKLPGHASVYIPTEKQQLMGIKLGTVERRRLTKNIRAPGQVTLRQGIRSLRQTAPIAAMVYEYELPLIKDGTPVTVTAPYYPDRRLKGRVQSIQRLPDPVTRAHRVLLRVEDPEKILRPQMYVDVEFEAEIGEVVAVPREAIVLTGEQSIVYVSKEEGHFYPQEVQLGERAKDFYEIKSGLEPGDSIIVSANFLIDSESRLQSALQGTDREGEVHQHGG